MKLKQSHILQRHLRTGLLDSRRMSAPALIAEVAILSAMRDPYSHAQMLLKKVLRNWELDQITLRLERDILTAMAGRGNKSDEAKGVLTAIVDGIERERLTSSGCSEGVATTAHLLAWVAGEDTLMAQKILELYTVTRERLLDLLPTMPVNEDIVRSHLTPRRREESELREEISEEDECDALAQKPAAKTRQIEKYAADLTRAAREGRLDPMTGREQEIERLVQILCRRKKNNPVLIGEPGVGKTAVVEALAMRIATGQVPAMLRKKQILSLDMAALMAGTKYRGEFENRLRTIIDEVVANKNITLFIDEIHTIVGAGSTQGSLDTANILKPALSRGELQCIGATTLKEFRECIEADGALERRFQKIIVEPATAAQTLEILTKVAPIYERHHGVRYVPEALKACVELTERYVTDRFFPDKAIDALDEAGSRAALRGCTQVGVGEIEALITSMTGVPVERVSQDERTRLATMSTLLKSRVIGQDDAVDKIVHSIRRSRTGLKEAGKPIGVFMLAGPTGVGKTHLCKELARWMFDSADALVRVDMGEYAEKHNVSRMIGSPPGYVGYGEGGQLTEAVRRQPYSVVLFDEIEKAHPDVLNVLLRIFDEGFATDGQGRRIDFRNTIIIMTTNAGVPSAADKAVAPVGYVMGGASAGSSASGSAGSKGAFSGSSAYESRYRATLERIFTPEFLNRINDIVLFNTLSQGDVERIVELELGDLRTRAHRLGVELTASPAALKRLAELGHDTRWGVRALHRTMLNLVEEPLAELLLGDLPLGHGTPPHGKHKVRIECSARGEIKLTQRIAVAA